MGFSSAFKGLTFRKRVVTWNRALAVWKNASIIWT